MGCVLSEEVISLLTPKNHKLPLGFLKQVLRNDKLFNDDFYINMRIHDIALTMKRRRVMRATYLFNNNDESNECYVIYRGKITIMRDDGRDLGTLEKGETLGMQGFKNHLPRSANALAITDVDVYYLTIEDFNRVVLNRVLTPRDLRNYDIFYSLTDEQKRMIFSSIKLICYNKNDVIISINDEPNYLYVVMAGSMKVKKSDKIEIEMNINSVYGIEEIISDKKHKSSVTAQSDCSLILIPSVIFKQDMKLAYNFFNHSKSKKKVL